MTGSTVQQRNNSYGEISNMSSDDSFDWSSDSQPKSKRKSTRKSEYRPFPLTVLYIMSVRTQTSSCCIAKNTSSDSTTKNAGKL